ncbi:protein PTHB1 [Lates japonicus]|uniref:Protein PTHB1 n=1 Tax=Lates japonicus TaxID=270547 RepID=A0AAD3MFH3_LATJO|nr:protein PTHB1 [Lates japonicus]
MKAKSSSSSSSSDISLTLSFLLLVFIQPEQQSNPQPCASLIPVRPQTTPPPTLSLLNVTSDPPSRPLAWHRASPEPPPPRR